MNEDAGDELTLLHIYRATGHEGSTVVPLRIKQSSDAQTRSGNPATEFECSGSNQGLESNVQLLKKRTSNNCKSRGTSHE